MSQGGAHAPRARADYERYNNPEAVLRYRRRTAGEGINHLLPTTYGPIFMDAARSALAATRSRSLRILEFGCGAGMALHYLSERCREEGIDVELALGTDFSPQMIAAARRDLEDVGSEWARRRLRFLVADNETLLPDVARALGESEETLVESFHLAVGVNTFRYAIRHGTSSQVVAQLDRLLRSGGEVVVIDMNDRFPYGLKPRRASSAGGVRLVQFGREWLPTLEEYARPFHETGFNVKRQEHFCWIPHSANGVRFRLMRLASPLLTRLVPDRAMRSLVVAAKPR